MTAGLATGGARRVALFLGSVGGIVPPADRAATGLAARRLGGAFRAFCLRDDAAARCYALGAGAAGVGVVEDLDGIEFDVALVGPAGAGPWGDLLPAWLAERRGAALALEVLDASAGPDGLQVVRDLGRGAREEMVLDGPAVLAVSATAPLHLYVSRRRQRAAALTDPGPASTGLADPLAAVSGPWEPWRPRPRAGAPGPGGSPTERLNALLGAEVRTSEAAGHVTVADPRTCAQALVRFLVHHGVVTRPGGRVGDAAGPGLIAADRPAGPPAPGAPAPEAGRERVGPAAGAALAAPAGGRLARGPRPLGSVRPARVAGPVPMPPADAGAPGRAPRDPAALSRLARGPRPPGQPRSSRITGPFPVS